MAAEEHFALTDLDGAEEVPFLSDDFVKSSPPLWMSTVYVHIIHTFVCNVNYIFLYV